MHTPDYDDPEIFQTWCDHQRGLIEPYLKSQNVPHRRIGDQPAWHVAPHVSLWAIESATTPNWIGCWVICGDLPTDYINAKEMTPPQHPRKFLRAIAERWLKQAEAWSADKEFSDTHIAGPFSHKQLAPLLKSRANILLNWANDDSLWEEP